MMFARQRASGLVLYRMQFASWGPVLGDLDLCEKEQILSERTVLQGG